MRRIKWKGTAGGGPWMESSDRASGRRANSLNGLAGSASRFLGWRLERSERRRRRHSRKAMHLALLYFTSITALVPNTSVLRDCGFYL